MVLAIPRVRFTCQVVASVCLALALGIPLGSAQQSTVSVAPDEYVMTSEEIFDRQRLLEVAIEVDEKDWDTIRTQSRNFAAAMVKPAPPKPYTWVRANITVDGHRISNVAIRKKGFIGSQDSERPSLKIKFDEYQDQAPIAGVDRLTLNNNKQDRALVSQLLTYQLFADAGLPCSRCNLAKVSVNGKNLGIYANVESIRKPMLRRVFSESGGKLYEGTVVDFTSDRIGDFEAKRHEEDDRQELRAIAKLLAEENVDLAVIEERIALDEFLKFWALESLIEFWDGYTNNQNNYFVYFTKRSGKLHFIPWGADSALSDAGAAAMFRRGPASVHDQAYLPNRLYHADGVPDRYRQVMEQLLEDVWDEEQLLAEVKRVEQLVKGHVHMHQEDYPEALEQTRYFVKSRRTQIARELNRWPRRIRNSPRKPFYVVKVGKATGTFETTWFETAPSDAYEVGSGELELTMNGKPVEFIKTGRPCDHGNSAWHRR